MKQTQQLAKKTLWLGQVIDTTYTAYIYIYSILIFLVASAIKNNFTDGNAL